MFDTRYDPPRSGRGTPQPDAVRWFFVYTSWTDIKGYVTDTTYVDQSCIAQFAIWHHLRGEWIATGQFVTLYDPQRTSKPAVGTLVRAHFNPINQHWEVWNPPSSAPSVIYSIDKGVEGWLGGANPYLEGPSNLTGWSGSVSYSGSESAVGIQYQNSETTPSANGNYKILKDGMFQIEIDGFVSIVASTTVATLSNAIAYTSGPASAGTAHTHQVTIPDFQGAIQTIGPRISIQLFNKLASGGANALHQDERSFSYVYQQNFPRITSQIRWNISSAWTVNLSQNDRISLKFIWTNLTYWKFQLVDSYYPRMRVTYLGPKQPWAAF